MLLPETHKKPIRVVAKNSTIRLVYFFLRIRPSATRQNTIQKNRLRFRKGSAYGGLNFKTGYSKRKTPHKPGCTPASVGKSDMICVFLFDQ